MAATTLAAGRKWASAARKRSISPARIFQADQSRLISSSDSGSGDLARRLEGIEAALRAIAGTSLRTAKTTEEIEDRGITVRTDEDTPLQVNVV